MKQFIFYFLIGCFFCFTSCKSQKTDTQLPANLFQHWKHAHEEDTETYQVYRIASYNFSPARARTGFEINKDGSFIHNTVAPNDAPETTSGKWKALSKKQLEVTLDNGKTMKILIQEVTSEVLKATIE